MARTKSDKYEDKRAEILSAAARLYAEHGYQGASIGDLADACGSSKSLIYHYYRGKEEILFNVMHDHVQALLATAKNVRIQNLSAEHSLRQVTRQLMQLYLGAADRQRVLLNELKRLPTKQRERIVQIQRELINIVESWIVDLKPELSSTPALCRPAAMLYFGMINWMHTWLNPKGQASPARIAELAINTFLHGITKAEIPK